MSDTTLDPSPTTDPPGDREPARPLSFWEGRGELLIGAVLLLMAAVLALGNLGMDVIGDGGLLGPQGFGWFVAALAAVVGALLVASTLRRTPERRRALAEQEGTNWRAVGLVLTGVIAFSALIDIVGWLVMATLMFATVATGLGNRNLLRNLTVGFVMAATVQIVFSGMLGLNLPSGLLGGL
ncbi:tripartite tricarboxylate transporter TctB family protein [Nocardiopsis changdeensis]|uniref:Tripartite tricarboxylate transporter TctB family protein n=1 Tax=Nocardiopsis changdeensis TaxID=2831969 RepID=A0ABX8BE56_9ACTN|nr:MULTISPECIES: tripartite tricarboxylate transporter TctB family protein [Nocardiopsis]QUX20537.1 tripartite tricarboxylate transporter TctB family protein [Nocardiopsis changdeensis]QYX36468.1 tripartite tricarboxylate transporter TctB family protein [Nocardiopsis sp. MT53]